MNTEKDIPFRERIEQESLMAVIDLTTKEPAEGGAPHFPGYLIPELNSLQVWDPAGNSLLAVFEDRAYTPSKP